MEDQYKLDEQEVRNLFENVLQILLKKNEDYGGASFDLGLNGNMVHLWDKVKRYKTLVERKKDTNQGANFEGVADTLTDIIGYSVIGLLMIKHGID